MGISPVTDHGHLEPRGHCWCCGSIEDPERMVRLGNHPEVAICLPCARWGAQEAGAIEDRDKTGLLVDMRGRVRHVRDGVIDRNWHRHRLIGGPLRWLGRHLP